MLVTSWSRYNQNYSKFVLYFLLYPLTMIETTVDVVNVNFIRQKGASV